MSGVQVPPPLPHIIHFIEEFSTAANPPTNRPRRASGPGGLLAAHCSGSRFNHNLDLLGVTPSGCAKRRFASRGMATKSGEEFLPRRQPGRPALPLDVPDPDPPSRGGEGADVRRSRPRAILPRPSATPRGCGHVAAPGRPHREGGRRVGDPSGPGLRSSTGPDRSSAPLSRARARFRRKGAAGERRLTPRPRPVEGRLQRFASARSAAARWRNVLATWGIRSARTSAIACSSPAIPSQTRAVSSSPAVRAAAISSL